MEHLSGVERARRHLLQNLRKGDQGPGSIINIKDIAVALGISPTPVREALERLAGEGIVQAGPGNRGFAMPRHVARELADLYRFLEILLRFAQQDCQKYSSANSIFSTLDQDNPALAVQGVLGAVADHTRNRTLSDEINRFINILAPYRVQEPKIIPNWLEELGDLQTSLMTDNQVAKSLRRHTKLRTQHVMVLLESVEKRR